MGFFTQKVALVVTVVVLVFVAAFVAQFNFGDKPDQPPPPPIDPGTGNNGTDPLIFPEMVTSRIECELKSSGHYDFWFHNPNDVPVEVGLEKKSCTCTDVRIGVVDPDGIVSTGDWKTLQSFATAATVARIVAGSQGLLPRVGLDGAITRWQHDLLTEKLNWHEIQAVQNGQKGNAVLVPKHGLGVVRMRWKGSERAYPEMRLTTQLWRQPPTSAIRAVEQRSLEVPIGYSAAIVTQVNHLDLDPQTDADTREANFDCWSCTRSQFAIEVKEAKNDPCFVCQWTPLTTEQTNDLEQKISSRVRFGYRVKVRVAEPTDKSAKLDLGPSARRIVVTSKDLEEPLTVTLSGDIKGFVNVSGDGRVTFKPFAIAKGAEQRVSITSEEADLELAVDRIDPEPLRKVVEVKLDNTTRKTDGGSNWHLTVKVPPNRADGGFPEQGAIYLKTGGAVPRRIRIPVSGQAYTMTSPF